MRQGAMELNGDFYKHFESNLQTLELAGGGHILCSLTLMDKASNDPTDDKIKLEEDKLNAMYLLKQLDMTRYQELIRELRNSVCLGIDEYPQMSSAVYNILVHRSGVINSGCGGGGQGHGGCNNDSRGE
eukprot:551059-Ditylum_brightwellii.AAC.1